GKITNVEAGTDLTDAVNVSQLNEVKDTANDKSVETVEGTNGIKVTHTDGDDKKYTVALADDVVEKINGKLIFQGDTGEDFERKLNETVRIEGGLKDEEALSPQANIGVVSDGENTLRIKLAKDIKLGSTGSIDLGGTRLVKEGLIVNNNGKVVKVTSDGIDAGDMVIKHVADGKESYDAVNVSQLKKVEEKAGEKSVEVVKAQAGQDYLTVTEKTPTTATNKEYTVALDTTKLITNIVNNNTTKTTLENGLDLTYKANGTGDKKVSLAEGLDFRNGTDTIATIGNNGEVSFDIKAESKAKFEDQSVEKVEVGTGLTVSSTDGTDKTYTIGLDALTTSKLNKEEEVASTNNNISVAQTKINSTGGKIFDLTLATDLTGISSIANGTTVVTLGDTEKVINVHGGKITNVAKGINDTDAVNVSQLKELKVQAGDKSVETVEGTNGVKVTHTSGDDKTYTVGLDTETKTKVDNAMQSIITSVDGNDVKTLTKDNNRANFISGDNITLSNYNGSIRIATKKDVSFDNVAVGPVVINKDTGINAGDKVISNVSKGLKDTDAVNLGQLKAVEAKIGTGGSGTGDQSVEKVDAGTGIEVTHTSGDDKTYTVALDKATQDKLNKLSKEESVVAGNTNLKVTQPRVNATGGKEFEVSLANDLTGINSITNTTNGAKITLGDTTKDISVSGGKITNLTEGTSQTDAVNVKQLQDYVDGKIVSGGTVVNIKNIISKNESITVGNSGNLVSGNVNLEVNTKKLVEDGSEAKKDLETGLDLTYKANGKDAKVVSLKDGLDFTNGKYTTATIDTDGKVVIDLDKSKLKDLGGGNSPFERVVDKNGNPTNIIVAKNGDNKKPAPQRITNIADGVQDNDAVNVGQLRRVGNEVKEFKNETRAGLANAAAMSTLEFMDIGVNQATVGAAVGTYKGKQAIAVGVQAAPTENTRVHAKVSLSSSKDAMAGIGASWRFNWK
ncbi:MAG: hypothetical protein CR959_01500, partial [Fusobacteriales bacterium]